MNKKTLVGVIVVAVLIAAVIAIAAEPLMHPHSLIVLPPVIEYLEDIPIENATAINWNSWPPGVYYYNYTVYNNSTYSLNVTLVFEDFPWDEGFIISWTNMTHHDLNMSIIEPSTSAIGDLTLVIPLGASGTYEWVHWLYVTEAT